MEFVELRPPPALAPWIEALWTLQGSLAPDGQLIVPDGRMEMVLHFGARPFANGDRQPGCLINPQLTQALELSSPERLDTVGIRLRPEAGCMFDRGLDQIWERAGNASSNAARLETICAQLESLALPMPDPAIAWSARAIETGGMARVPDGLSVRQWQRRFRAAVGLTPKKFARITRLQRAIALHEAAGTSRRWAELALEAGYYDQPHLANEFRSLTGQSPDAFFRGGRGMIEFYRDAFFQDRRRGLALR